MRSPIRKVALIYNATLGFDIKVMSGVAAYLREGTKWNVYLEENSLKDQRLPELYSWRGDGIIANFDNRRVAAAVMHSELPTVGFGSGYGWYPPNSGIPYFSTDKKAVAHLAADHLIERGFRHFAFCGIPRSKPTAWSEERGQAFAEYVARQGFTCQVYRGRHKISRAWTALQRSLGQWLALLPKPVGLMAANDHRARQVLEVCRAIGLRVPEDVAVIGVDNDELLCQFSTPLLTSIEQGAMRIGYEAAALLDRMMAGENPRQRWILIGPVGVVTRLSTDVLATENRKVATAMAFIREHACEGIKVRDVVAAASVSRSGLDSHLKAVLGRSLHTLIRQVQLDRAFALVQDTDLPLKQVAAKAGFKSAQQLSFLFSKRYGSPPGKFRGGAGTQRFLHHRRPTDAL